MFQRSLVRYLILLKIECFLEALSTLDFSTMDVCRLDVSVLWAVTLLGCLTLSCF